MIYPKHDYSLAIHALEALTTGGQVPQPVANSTCNIDLLELRKEVKEIKEIVSKLQHQHQPQPQPSERAPYSKVLQKGLATSQTPQNTQAARSYKKPDLARELDRKEYTLVLTKSKDKELPPFDPGYIRDQVNASLQTDAIKGVHISPKGNIVLTLRSITASELLEKQLQWQPVFQGWPITNAQQPESWPKLIAHFVPTSLSPSSFTEEIERFNDIEIRGTPRWLSSLQGKAHSSMIFSVLDKDRASCLKNGIWIQGQHLQVTSFKAFTPKTQCRRCLGLGHDPASCRKPYICGYCAGKHPTKEHSCKDCNSKTPCIHTVAKCSNCKQTGHTAFDKKTCEILKALC